MVKSTPGLNTPFVGRTAQLAVATTAAATAASGQPTVIWVEGVAGSGKTTLARHALANLPEGFVTRRVRCDELAKDVAFDLAGQLGVSGADSPFAAAQQLLAGWAHLQEQGPVAVLVEDVHWADAESAAALITASRRLDQDRVLLVITSRPETGAEWDRLLADEDRCQRILVGNFDTGEVAALAALRGIELTERQAARLCEHTGGHPIWVRTLLTELTPAELKTVGSDLPAPRSLASAVTARLAELPPAARDLTAALAVINQASPLPLVGRVAGIAAPLEALESVLSTGFVRWEPDQPGPPIEFAHPLYRQAIYADLSPTRRRDLHRSAARALTPGTVLAHRVAAADGADDELADELEAVAVTDRAAGATALAARNLLWASSLSANSVHAERRLLEAALAYLDSGQSSQAAGLRAQLEGCRSSPLRSLLLGLIDWELGETASARRLFVDAASPQAAETDRRTVSRAWAQLAEIAVITGQPDQGVDAAQKALEWSEPHTPAERLGWIHLATSEALLRGGPAGLQRLRERLPEAPSEVADTDVDLLVTRATIGYYSAEPRQARADLEVVLGMVRRGRIPIQLARCHFLMAALLTNTGEFQEAELHARTALSIATDDHLVWMQAQCHAALATLLACRGDADGADLQLSRARLLVSGAENPEAAYTVQLAAGAIARARNDPAEVIAALGELPALIPMISALYFWPALVIAYIDTQRLDQAGDEIIQLERAAAARSIDVEACLLGLRARHAAASGNPERADELFGSALAHLNPDLPVLDRASLQQAYAGLLLARGNRRLAAEHFRTARDLLTAATAQPFIDRLDSELQAARLGGPTFGSQPTAFALTDRERDVALLVARGLSNPEVAERLYISRKAVEYHLSNVYLKVGIKSRRQLRDIRLA